MNQTEVQPTVTRTPPTEAEVKALVHRIARANISLYGMPTTQSWLSALRKSDGSLVSGQGVAVGQKSHPFDRARVKELQLFNEYHATAIHTKVASTVGLGFLSQEERIARDAKEQMRLAPPQVQPQTATAAIHKAFSGGSWKISKVDEMLNPLCDHSWQDVLSAVCEDFWQVGEGYIEVVRAPGGAGLGPITGLHHIPAEDIWLHIEDELYNKHYKVMSREGTAWNRAFAVFGDLASFQDRALRLQGGFKIIDRNEVVSEVIPFRRPTSLSRWYGFPDWLSATAAIELMQCLRQWKYDFFNNRGVPEFFLWVLGQQLEPDQWKKITDALDSTVGAGNQHKTLATNLANDQIKIQIDKLGMEGQSDDATDKTNETYALAIVSAHGVPPLLAGIQIPGKLGATNELPNALRGFQALKIGGAQRIFQQRLGQTLGDPAFNGGLGLTMEDFTFRRILDEIDLNAMDTSTQMRQTETAAASQGRDLHAGLKH